VVSLWVVNASPIILLTKVHLFDVLRHLGPPLVVPEAVVKEIQRRGSSDPAVQALAQALWIPTVDPGPLPPGVATLNLGSGESAVLAAALGHPGAGVIIDDQAARNTAAKLGIPFQGRLALVLFAMLQGLVAAARPVIEQLRHEGMYLSDKIMNQALAQVGE
jgi:predicted nucleic acid-binding protein